MARALAAILSVTAVLMGSSAVHAQVTLDVTKVTCRQFAAYKITNPDLLAVWISGYYHGARGEMVRVTP
jgi:acid stress chaperone HdeB